MTDIRQKVDDYINQFHVLGKDELLNCDNIVIIFYGVILNKFRTTLNETEYFYFKEYQERVFNLVEDLREKNAATLDLVLTYLGKINVYLADIIIMLWCLPRTDEFLSRKIYNNRYRANIEKYNKHLVKNINNQIVRNFCIETITKTNNVPVHCIDILWRYMDTLSIEFDYYNINSSGYIGFTMPQQKNGYTRIGLDLEYILEMGLGKIVYDDDPKGSFASLIKKFVSDPEIISQAIVNQNYYRQFQNINKNYEKYFGTSAGKISQEKLAELRKLIE